MTWQDGDPSSSGMRLFVALVVVCPIFQFFILKSFFWARSNSINSRSSFTAFNFNLFLFPSHHLRLFVFNISNQTWRWWTRTDCFCLAFSLTFWTYVGLTMVKIKFSVFTKNQDVTISLGISHFINLGVQVAFEIGLFLLFIWFFNCFFFQHHAFLAKLS